MHPLDQDTALERLGDGRLKGRTGSAYSNFNGTFGGFTAAVLLRAVLEDPRRQGVPVALTVNYCAAVADGAFEVTLPAGVDVVALGEQLAEAGRSLGVGVSLRPADDDVL